ncbi:MAG: hypothetical protein RIT45_3717, partial [Pseudomonadota bacterium]
AAGSFGCGSDDASTAPACAERAPAATLTCLAAVGEREAACVAETGSACAADDAAVQAALAALDADVAGACKQGEFGALSTDAVRGRLAAACRADARALAWRVYGGPQGAAWAKADAAGRSCLTATHAAARALLRERVEQVVACAAATGGCDESALATQRAEADAAAKDAIDAACPDLAKLLPQDAQRLVGDVAEQADCVAATVLPTPSGLPLRCGAAAAEIAPPRGQWSEVVLDGTRWGTKCGDGSEYAFWIRPAPAGVRLDRVVVALQGGGVCLFENDCTAKLQSAPQLFSARGADDVPLAVGLASDDPKESFLHDWTMVYLPYCTQDVFAGGGVDEALGAITVPRYGSVNLRAAVRVVRDWLWRELDDAGGDGYRPDAVVAFFGGFSAGGYGALYNYHWMLDTLGWPRTIGFPDGGLALDNGQALGVGGLGAVKIPAWGMRPLLPPYCFAGPCSSGRVMLEAISPRLLQVPEQRILMLSNQYDETQRKDAFFPDTPSFVNAMRKMACETRELPGVAWYLASESNESIHVISPRTAFWTGAVAGQTLNDFFATAVDAPTQLQSRFEEGDFVQKFPGVEAFPCTPP